MCTGRKTSKERFFGCSIHFMNQLKCYQPELNPSQLFVNFDGFPVSCFHGFGVARRPASADVTTTRRRKTKDLCLGGKKNRQPVQRLIEIAVKSCCIFGSEKHIFISFVSHIIFQLQRLVRLICDYIETIYETISLKVICDV